MQVSPLGNFYIKVDNANAGNIMDRMIVTCQCGAKYRFDERKLKGASQKRTVCPKCGDSIILNNPDLFSTKVHEEVLESHLKHLDRPKFALTIVKAGTGGTVVSLDQPRLTIGRLGADIEIEDPEASRIHAELQIEEDRVILRDLNSSNGTFVAGKRITEVVFHDDAVFQIGQTVFTLHKVMVTFD